MRSYYVSSRIYFTHVHWFSLRSQSVNVLRSINGSEKLFSYEGSLPLCSQSRKVQCDQLLCSNDTTGSYNYLTIGGSACVAYNLFDYFCSLFTSCFLPRSTPMGIISSLLGHEGQGSVLALLKEK